MAHGPDPAAPRPPREGGRRAHFPPHHAAPRNCYAALDLGTNNCRLLIARPAEDGFVVVDAFSRIVRLGEGLATSGELSEAAMDRPLLARNGREFVQRVYRETGIALEIISAEQEARLAVLGCHALLEPGEGNALVFDIGGGSTELILIDAGQSPPRVIDWFSAPWGVVSLTETEPHVGHDRDGLLTSYAHMRGRVADSFAQFAARLQPDARPGRLLGTSGTVTTLASVHLDLPSYDRRQIDGLIVPVAAMRDISTRLAGMSVSERAELPCIGQERADLVVAGCAILDAILDIWPAERLGVADRGIREGILRSLMARDRARNLM